MRNGRDAAVDDWNRRGETRKMPKIIRRFIGHLGDSPPSDIQLAALFLYEYKVSSDGTWSRNATVNLGPSHISHVLDMALLHIFVEENCFSILETGPRVITVLLPRGSLT